MRAHCSIYIYNVIYGKLVTFTLQICKPELCTLNKRNELSSSCRHANKFLLTNT